MIDIKNKIIEIELPNGNTAGVMEIENGEIIKMIGLSYADQDRDYFFDTDKILVRLALEEKESVEGLIISNEQLIEGIEEYIEEYEYLLDPKGLAKGIMAWIITPNIKTIIERLKDEKSR